MTQKEIDLLLKDLCARLPYNVKIKIKTYEDIDEIDSIGTLRQLNKQYFWILEDEYERCIEYNKPYLFPFSSMTEQQKQEYTYIVNYISSDDTENWVEGEFIYVEQFTQLMHFYHINHLDYMGLIPMGLAIDATGLNIY